jgi:hypothetical protein
MRMTEEQYQAFLAKGPQPIPVISKRPKYGNRKVTDAEGNVHDSTKEYRRWCELQLRERAGEITRLRRQVPFAMVVNGILVCQYIADVVYDEGQATIVEDCKSPQTRKLAAFAIKRKLMQAIHGIEVREV